MLDSASLRLVSVYHTRDCETLYELLRERTKNQNISHKRLPTWEEHMDFVGSKPYLAWYYIVVDESDPKKRLFRICTKVGAIYLTDKNEVGLFVFKKYKGKGFGSLALDIMLEAWPGANPVYANINPKNEASKEFFKAKGFKLLQETYVLERKKNRS